MAPTTRLQQVIRIIREELLGREYRIKVEKHRIVEDTEYLRLIVTCEGFEIHIREFLISKKIIRYSYQLIVGGEPVLRYDSVPHHPEVTTYPHHKHVRNRVCPLSNYSLKAFLKEGLKLIT